MIRRRHRPRPSDSRPTMRTVWRQRDSWFDRRSFRVGSLVVLIALLSAPVLFDSDDYPLSTYPMYASTRSSEVSFVTAYGVDIEGNTVRLGLGIIGATDDPLIAAGELRAALRSGHAAQRCAEIAGRIDSQSDIVNVEVVTERHNVIDHTLDRPSIVERQVHTTCPVGPVR